MKAPRIKIDLPKQKQIWKEQVVKEKIIELIP